MFNNNVREQDLLWLLDPDFMETLSRNEWLISSEYNKQDNGSWSMATVHHAGGTPYYIQPTTCLK